MRWSMCFGNRSAIVMLLVLTVVVSVWQYIVTEETSRSLLPLSHAVADIGQDIAEFHIWIEELLQGDEHLNRSEVMGLLDAVLERIEAILAGGVIQGARVPDIDDPVVQSTMIDLRSQVIAFRSLAEERFMLGDAGVSGTEIDQRFDEHFVALTQTYDELTNQLDSHLEENLLRASRISLLLIILSIVVKISIFVLLLSSHRAFQRLIGQLSNEITVKEAALSEVRQSQQAKSSFLAMISHELRTPLNAIMGYSEVMKIELFGDMPPKYKDYSKAIYISAERFLSVVNALIELSKIDGNQATKKIECINISELVEEILKILYSYAEENGVFIINEVTEDADSIMTDRKLLFNIIINISHNAIKFTPDGGHVRVGCYRHDDHIDIVVEDTGIGMAEEEVEVAMRAFSPIDPHLSRPGDGSGLGLPLAKLATESLGGIFSITSSKGFGTRVLVSLPRS